VIMSSYTIAGYSKCGALIMYSCGCFPSARMIEEMHTKTNPYFKGFKCKAFFDTNKQCRNLTNF
jgi:hypothetical protein